MNRYIDKDLLLQTIDELVYSGVATPEDILDAVKNIIDDIYHTTDAAPVVHGRWIEYPRAHYFKCSNCKYTVPHRKANLVNGKREYNYCPHCGAKMDWEEQNNA